MSKAKNIDKQRFRNEDLVLNVSKAVNRSVWDEGLYTGFLEELCGSRDYQKEAIKTALRYLLSGEYQSLRDLAKQNFDEDSILQQRYGSWKNMERQLQLPNQLSASLDLATGTGKSYILYGIAAILLAEGKVKRVLVLCPSTTIEYGLIEKFKDLATNKSLRDLLPSTAKISSPSIINASQSIPEGAICVENYHAVLEHVGSSIRDSLLDNGNEVAVLNDETHHVANNSGAKEKRWKEFLTHEDYSFRYIIGVSGTCYIKDEYFTDVIYRYSLHDAMEQRYIKTVDYISEMPKTGAPDERWQLIYNRHNDNVKRLISHNLKPLTIIVTHTIKNCENVADDLRYFLTENNYATIDDIDDKILVVYNGAPDVIKLPNVDNVGSSVEWIISVSMLNEGWDVKRVFQIVPHAERAFNSKLLISQVLGRGLRIPDNWQGDQPSVTVFNHDAWASSIRHLVNEILEIERRIPSFPIEGSEYHFDLHHISYEFDKTTIETAKVGNYKLFEKGFVNLSSELAKEDVDIEFERASSGNTYKWKTQIRRKTYSTLQVAQAMYERLEDAQYSENEDRQIETSYTDEFPIERLEEIIKKSLENINKAEITEGMKQKFLSSLGTLRRKAAKSVRYVSEVKEYSSISTKTRRKDSVSLSELRQRKILFYTSKTQDTLSDENSETFNNVIEVSSAFRKVLVPNYHDFKTPLNAVIADSENENTFIKRLIEPDNNKCFQSWIKSSSTGFYEIDFAWRKGEHAKQGKFNPDFFIKVNETLILIIEIKDDTEIYDPSEENIKKNDYAKKHFSRINLHLESQDSDLQYQFHFLTPKNFNSFFQHLKETRLQGFQSELDVKLSDK